MSDNMPFLGIFFRAYTRFLETLKSYHLKFPSSCTVVLHCILAVGAVNTVSLNGEACPAAAQATWDTAQIFQLSLRNPLIFFSCKSTLRQPAGPSRDLQACLLLHHLRLPPSNCGKSFRACLQYGGGSGTVRVPEWPHPPVGTRGRIRKEGRKRQFSLLLLLLFR